MLRGPAGYDYRVPEVAIVFMSVPRRLKSVISAPVPFVATYESADRIRAEQIKNQHFDGLLWLHATDQDQSTVITTYWRSRDDFLRYGAALADDLGAKTCLQGFVRDPHDARSFWKRITLRGSWALFATLVTLVSGLSILAPFVDRWTAEPDLEIYSERRIYDILDDSLPDVKFSISSRSPTAQRVDLSTSVQPSFVDNLRVAPQRIRELQPYTDDRADVTMPPLGAGKYTLRLTARAQAGSLRNPKTFSHEVTLQVWERMPRLAEFVLEKSDVTHATFRYAVAVGNAAPEGILLDVVIARVPKITQVITDAPGSITERSWTMDDQTPGSEVGKTTVRLPPAEAFRTRTYRLLMWGEGVDWNQVRDSAQIHVSLPEKAGTPE